MSRRKRKVVQHKNEFWYRHISTKNAILVFILGILSLLIKSCFTTMADSKIQFTRQSVSWKPEITSMVISPSKYWYFPWIKEDIIPWAVVEEEVRNEIFPQVDQILPNENYTFKFGYGNHIIEIHDSRDSDIAHLWLGYNIWTDGNDSLIRIGKSNRKELWCTYERHPDGSYQKVKDFNVPDSFKVNLIHFNY